LSDPMATIESAAVVEAGTETVVFGDRDLDAADPHAVRLAIPVKAADWELLYIVGDIENAGFAVAVIGTLVSFLVALVVLLLTRGRIRAREMSARLSLVADEAPSVLFEYEVDEGGRVRTLLVSSAVRGLLGMTQEEAMEQGILSPIPATERLAIDDAVRVEAPWRVQFLFQGESGQQRWLLAQGAPSGTGAAQGLWRGSITDVTAEVERENAALREAEDERDLAEARTQSQREFLALMSHELRTPLNAVIGFQHLLGETDLNDRQQGLLRRSNEAADLLMATIADVLDFSKTEADALELESVASNVGVILAEVCSVTQVLAEQRGLELRRIDAPDLPPAIMTDPTRLRQLLLNLMGNAVKFTEVGYVQIATSRVTLDGGLPGLRFEVSDSGIGIDPERLAHIFEPFRQADASTSRRFGGTGLGLAISRRIAEAMGGGIHVLSEAEGGTTFTVEIAAKPATGALPGRQSDVGSSSIVGADATPLRLDGVRLLVAEDNEFNGEIVVDVLQAVGAEVELVTDGQQAVRKVRENSYDVIVLDVQMPVMDGLTAARVMLQTGLSGSTPIVALTANALAEDRALCLEAGMSDIVVKPVDPPVLVRALRKIISRSYEGASH
jgi:signal transduction histidine kinase/BarA-like signal transduction histidine kinase